MGALVFDTLIYTKNLEAAGVPREVAEAHAEALAGVIKDRLVTKDDINELRTELKSDIKRLENKIDRVETKLENKIEHITYQLTIRLGSLMAAGIVLLGAFNKLV